MATCIAGLNHVTLAVTDVKKSLAFYRDTLGCTVRAIWPEGAYLEAGSLWLCLSYDTHARLNPNPDYTHIAFTVADADFPCLSERLIAECAIWKDNESEGASTYFLDPDGHKLEIHVGSLSERLAYYQAHPEKGVIVLDD